MTDAELLHQFESLTLPFTEWTHRAHVKVAYLYLTDLPFNLALEKISTNIQRYNAHNNVPEGPTSGYNQTTTHAFLHLVASVMSTYGPVFPTPDADTFCDTHPQLMTRHILRLFYSPTQRMHRLSKTQFIEPDLAPLPKIMDK